MGEKYEKGGMERGEEKVTTPSGCACHPSTGGELWQVRDIFEFTRHNKPENKNSPPVEGCPAGAGWCFARDVLPLFLLFFRLLLQKLDKIY